MDTLRADLNASVFPLFYGGCNVRVESSSTNEKEIIAESLQLVCADTVCLSKRLAIPGGKKTIGYRDTSDPWVSPSSNNRSRCHPARKQEIFYSSTSRHVCRRCLDAIRIVRARAPPHAAPGLLFGDSVGDLVCHLHHPRLLENAAC